MHRILWLPSFQFVAGLYLVVALASVLVPGPIVTGYARGADGKPLRYRVNGLGVFVVVTAGWLALGHYEILDLTLLSLHFAECFLIACVLGLLASLYFYVCGPFPDHVCAPKVVMMREERRKNRRSTHLMDFFFGFELNPRYGLFDFKMYAYLVGAVLLELIVISFAVVEISTSATHTLSLASAVYLAEMTWFLIDYNAHEKVHLFTYDLVDENMGFKLVWGCLCFYPFFYPLGFPSLSQPHDVFGTGWAFVSVCVFLCGYILSRGANNQKYAFKTNPQAPFMGIVEQRSLEGKILVSGWWGLSRHINYLGEILMGIGLALPGGLTSALPWLYPTYYVLLLVSRERDDHLRCQTKYGAALWKKYEQLVPYRIIPYLY
eukprot:TRINITY_DN294_c0_g1_i13.p1 TRINITY_DN294_c0_g1~~TRINITY_DN294_c0_g1_i13.p1  ORF type:complete len:377 (+),score=88.34 TRINITY_DN294_c0_g1_i13:1121-2251(+)